MTRPLDRLLAEADRIRRGQRELRKQCDEPVRWIADWMLAWEKATGEQLELLRVVSKKDS